jgi:hypothetical protein
MFRIRPTTVETITNYALRLVLLVAVILGTDRRVLLEGRQVVRGEIIHGKSPRREIIFWEEHPTQGVCGRGGDTLKGMRMGTRLAMPQSLLH